MKVVFIFLHLINGSVTETSLMVADPFSCHSLLEQIAQIDYPPKGVTYKGEEVLFYYCKNEAGQYVG